jgi:flavin-dependent dehydrogenase
MTTRGESQVLVIGAGPAGCAAGIVLARAGIDVAVIERARFPRDKTCGDAVSNLAMELIDELGAGQSVRDGPHAVVKSGVAVFPDGTRIARFYDRPGYIVSRRVLGCARCRRRRRGRSPGRTRPSRRGRRR